MTHIRLRYVQAFYNKKAGIIFRYFRRPGSKRLRLPGMPGSPEFNEAYERALAGLPAAIGADRTKAGSVSAAIVAYYTSLEFRSLTGGTPAMRRAILERFRARHGDKPIALLPQKTIAIALSQMGPFAARNWLKAIRHLMQFAVTQGMREDDPTQGIRLPRVKSTGIYSWEEADIAAYEVAHPIGSKARLALALPLYTAQRRSDVIRMGRQHIRAGVVTVRQQKTGVTLAIPVHSDLQAIIDATAGDHLTLLVTKTGKPYAPNDFSEQFREWCDAAGLPKECSVHGLRKAACRRLAEAGCSASEIGAISGHATLSELQRYTKAADQAHMARKAMARQQTAENELAQPIVKLPGKFDRSRG
jgi:integrase